MLSKLKLIKTAKGMDSLLMLSAILIIWMGNYGTTDMLLNGGALAGSVDLGTLHNLLFLFATGLIILALWDTLHPIVLIAARRRALRVAALSAILIPLIMYLLPFFSDGYFLAGTSDIAANIVWCLLAVPLFILPRQPRVAAIVAGIVLLFAAAVFYLAQVANPHFFTHTLWTAWIASFVVYLLHCLLTADDALA